MEKKLSCTLRMDKKTNSKFHYVCEYNGRSLNMEMRNLINKLIRAFENQHGEIPYNDN